MPSIPWDVIGAGGTFVIVVLGIVFGFMIKMKKLIEKSTEGKTQCVDHPGAQEAMKNNILTHEAVVDIRAEMKEQTKEMVKQTTLLRIMARRVNGGPMNFD